MRAKTPWLAAGPGMTLDVGGAAGIMAYSTWLADSPLLVMKVALVHYWLLTMRGGEKVLEALCQMFPEADIFTMFADRDRLSPLLQSRTIHTSFLQPLRAYHRYTLPLMPYAVESFDLRGYDLIISSESGPAKQIVAPSTSRHICYTHTPMRYLWDLYHDHLQWSPPVQRALLPLITKPLRTWDYASAARVDQFIANSENVRRRIWKTYRREATVICPPVDIDSFFHRPSDGYYLMVAELVPYKRAGLAIAACSRTSRRLKIVGTGPASRELRRQAGPSIEFLGRVDDQTLRDLYAHCRAFVMPAEEDFGISAVEALASGKPVIAWARGGALEIVASPEAPAGILFPHPDEASLIAAFDDFERREQSFDPASLQRAASRFHPRIFDQKIRHLIEQPESYSIT